MVNFFLFSKRFLFNVVQFLSVIFRTLEFSDGKSIVFLMKEDVKDVRRWDRSLVIEERNHTASLAEGGGPLRRTKLVLYCGFGVVMFMDCMLAEMAINV